jgi:hypothetical protein
MPNLVLELLKYAFLAILYIFVARAVKAVYLELKTPNPRRASSRAPAPARPPSRRAKKAPRKLAIVEGDSMQGKSFDVGEELVVGRAEKCHIVLDDTYVSQMHARIFSKGESVMVEDLGSTNGTYLNRRRVAGPMVIKRRDKLQIGNTVLELQ